MSTPARLQDVQLFAWLGEDEHGSGVVGLKQGFCPAGFIPLVATTEPKMSQFRDNMFHQARMYGKKIYLCRYQLVEVVEATETGEPLL